MRRFPNRSMVENNYACWDFIEYFYMQATGGYTDYFVQPNGARRNSDSHQKTTKSQTPRWVYVPRYPSRNILEYSVFAFLFLSSTRAVLPLVVTVGVTICERPILTVSQWPRRTPWPGFPYGLSTDIFLSCLYSRYSLYRVLEFAHWLTGRLCWCSKVSLGRMPFLSLSLTFLRFEPTTHCVQILYSNH